MKKGQKTEKRKKINGQFSRDIREGTDKEKSWLWMRKCNLKIPIEALICFAQEQAIITSCVKFQTDKSVDSPSCRMCGETDKTIVISLMNAQDQPRGNKKTGMTMQLKWLIENCVRKV